MLGVKKVYLYLIVMSPRCDRDWNARIMANLASVRTIAQMINEEEYNYSTLCDPSTHKLNRKHPSYGEEMVTIEDNINRQYKDNNLKCYAGDEYCVQVKLRGKRTGYYCIDSHGRAGTTTTDPGCSATSLRCNL